MKGYVWNEEIAKATSRVDLHPVLAHFGQWAVTLYGVECTEIPYFFEFDRVDESDWVRHMSEKEWVNMFDFCAALDDARRRVKKPKGRRRFLVLRRDDYSCQLCGRSAREGAQLEVDHKHPKARGGSDDIDNLWTLCEECNRGKSDLSL